MGIQSSHQKDSSVRPALWQRNPCKGVGLTTCMCWTDLLTRQDPAISPSSLAPFLPHSDVRSKTWILFGSLVFKSFLFVLIYIWFCGLSLEEVRLHKLPLASKREEWLVLCGYVMILMHVLWRIFMGMPCKPSWVKAFYKASTFLKDRSLLWCRPLTIKSP